MAATVTIRRWTGSVSSPTKTNITSTNTRANAEDAHSISGTNNSILIPAAGSNFSYWVSTRLSVDAIQSGTVDNIRWFTDGTNNFGTGVTCVGNIASNYIQATGTPGQTGTELSTNTYSTLSAPPVDVFSFSSSFPQNIPGSTSQVSDLGSFFVYQIQVASSASAGATASETFTWRYDDTSA